MHPARSFALGAHGNQMYGNEPYIYHLDNTVNELTGIMNQPAFRFYDKALLRSAAYLHDILEDTEITNETLTRSFGPLVTEIVHAVSDGPGKNRDERKSFMYVKVQQCGPAAVAIKLADRMANVRNCVEHNDKGLLEMYRKEHLEFKGMLENIIDVDPIWVKLGRMVGV